MMSMPKAHRGQNAKKTSLAGWRTWLIGSLLTTAGAAHAQANDGLQTKVQEIMDRSGFENARWGVEFYSPDTKQPLYSLNSDQLFQPASAIKVFIEATAFSTLGSDYRFHTRVYRTGPVVHGVLKGDLVLVASGDLLLGGRIKPDGTLAMPEPDHTYDPMGAVPAPGDPLQSIREIASQVAAHGIRRIEGRVLVDDSLFRQGTVDLGGSGPFVVSPMMINDNLVDVTVTPDSEPGIPGVLHISPQTGYLHIVNQTRTTAPAAAMPPNGPGALRFTDDVTNPDGSHTVTLTGDVPAASGEFRAYRITDPVHFAEMALTEALQDKGIKARLDTARPDLQALVPLYTKAHLVAEHVSPPLSTEVQVMTKVSSNLHTGYFPYLYGAIAGHERGDAKTAGNGLRSKLFRDAGLDPDAPGISEDKYTPDFFVRFLTYLEQQPYFQKYREALPIMGKDGSLTQVQMNLPAAGHVYAKTGTGLFGRKGTPPHVFKALAGYIECPNGRWMPFAAFVDFQVTSFPTGMKMADQAGEALGEIASAGYQAFASPSSDAASRR